MSVWIQPAQCGHYVPGRPSLPAPAGCERCKTTRLEPAGTDLITDGVGQPPAAPLPNPVICSALLAIQPCAKCAAPLSLPKPRGRRLTQCRGGCARRHREPRLTPPPAPSTCKTCGGPIDRPRRGKAYCRPRCRIKGNARRCEVDRCSRPHQARGLCNHHYSERYYPGSRGQWPTDPEAKRKRDLVKSKRRRAATRGVHTENVDRDVVGERDGWRCFCRKRVNRMLVYPHPMSPSLDHVIPLSQGGAHTYANTRIAHWRCNHLRSNRGGSEQLALIG